MRLATLLFLVSFGAQSSFAQTTPSQLEFEVATVKLIDPNVPHMVGIELSAGGRLKASALSLKAMIGAAFGLEYWQISGGESWMEREQFDVDAKPPENSGITDLRYTLYGISDPRLRGMLQALLIERFGLKYRLGTKAGDVYELKRSGKPWKLTSSESPPGGADPKTDRGTFGSIGYAGARWVIARTSMAQLAKHASAYILHSPVLDATGMPGLWDYRQVDRDTDPNYSDPAPSFLRMIEEIGLKLERTKGSIETLVIDSAVRPSAN